MVDVDQRSSCPNPSHSAALRRLSARAAALSQPVFYSSPALHRLMLAGFHIRPGLSESELARVETEFGFTFPADLRSLLSAGLPEGPGFPDWGNVGGRSSLRDSIDFAIAAVSLQITRGFLWCPSWGIRPVDPKKAIRAARNVLKKSPLLIPVFGHCYIPCNPSLAGNPVFSVDENRVICCGSDLSDFFHSSSFFSGYGSSTVCGGGGRMEPRWVEFWSDAAGEGRRQLFSTPEKSSITVDVPPEWVTKFIGRMGRVLKDGGWSESDVEQIVHVSASWGAREEVGFVDRKAQPLDSLLLTTKRVAGSMLRAGWSSKEVSEALLGLSFRPGEESEI